MESFKGFLKRRVTLSGFILEVPLCASDAIRYRKIRNASGKMIWAKIRCQYVSRRGNRYVRCSGIEVSRTDD